MSFNLVDEPFIPCLLAGGTREELGVRDALLRAHEIRELRDGSPLVTVTLHRLLLAVLHRVYPTGSLADWKKVWRAGRFDAGKLGEYLQQVRHRLDPFDADHPFYQTGGMATDRPLPVAALFDELACNNNATLFDHSTNEGGRAASAAEAARGLIVRQAFALGLGVSPDVTIRGRRVKTGNRKDGPLARGLLVLVRGHNLFETLLCNLTQYSPSADDLPVWERDDPEALVGQARADGRLDLYTFQCRRLRLVPEGDGPGVSHVHFAQGRAPDPQQKDDPMKPYRKDPKRGWVEFGISEERAVWRDSSALLELTHDQERPFAALNWLDRAAAEGVVPRHALYSLDTFAVGTKPGKASSIILWRHERMPLPLAYLDDRDLVAALKAALALAEEAGRSLRKAAWLTASLVLAPDAGRKPDTDRVRDLVDGLVPERAYWSALEVPFKQLLVDLPGAGSQGRRTDRLARWMTEVVGPAARDAFDASAGRMDHSGRFLRAAAVGRRYLDGELARVAAGRNVPASPTKESAHA